MSWHEAEKIADALLYEGYLLYPYRGSAVKNRYRWQFGIVAPRGYAESAGGEAWAMQTECLVEPAGGATIDLKVRFLHVETRQVEAPAGAPGRWTPVDRLPLQGRELVTWDEAVPRELVLTGVPVGEPAPAAVYPFEVPGARQVEVVRGAAGEAAARVVRERFPLAAAITVGVERAGRLRKLTIRVENHTPWAPADGDGRPAALRRSLVAAHTLLAVTGGSFVSLLDPPAGTAGAVAACTNLHTFPVLVGEAPRRDLMLSSPIILYDYPSVAPESPGDLFDGTEIDEILTLRLRTLTDGERRQARATDPRAAELIERAAHLSPEHLERLHGAIRSLGPAAPPPPVGTSWEGWLNPPGAGEEEALDGAGRHVRRGSRVRLRPRGGADAMDMFLAGQPATVAAVHRDLEDQRHVAVALDAGMAADLHDWNGRYYYFRPEEVEVVDPGPVAPPAPARDARVLVAGIGNVFLGDDGFGSAVVERLASRTLPAGVRVEDFGIRSVHLAYDLLDAAYETTILVDATSRGGAPGTLYLLEPEAAGAPAGAPDAHALDVESVLGLLRGMGGDPGRVLIVGCEPESLDPEMGLSAAVAGALDGAVEMVMKLVSGAKG